MKDPCGTCGSTDWRFWRKKFEKGKPIEYCDRCEHVRPTVFRDAAGNRVSYSSELEGKYSYAIDAPITSQRQFAEHLRTHNLVQKEH